MEDGVQDLSGGNDHAVLIEVTTVAIVAFQAELENFAVTLGEFDDTISEKRSGVLGGAGKECKEDEGDEDGKASLNCRFYELSD